MLNFNFPTLTADLIVLDFSDFLPAPENTPYGNDCPAFWFGNAAVCFRPAENGVHPVYFMSNYDVKVRDWLDLTVATCDTETYKAMYDYYYNNI